MTLLCLQHPHYSLILIHVSSNVCTFPQHQPRHHLSSLSVSCSLSIYLALPPLVQPCAHSDCVCVCWLSFSTCFACVFIRFLFFSFSLFFCFYCERLPFSLFVLLAAQPLRLSLLFAISSSLLPAAFVPVSRERATYKAKHVKGERAKSGQSSVAAVVVVVVVGPRRLLFALQQLEASKLKGDGGRV